MITKQEMFDRAWRGLKGQGWRRCGQAGSCYYAGWIMNDGTVIRSHQGRPPDMRCAWGHVDPEGTEHVGYGDVLALADYSGGLAPRLSCDELTFAKALQRVHDKATDETLMERMVLFAAENGLEVPQEVP